MEPFPYLGREVAQLVHPRVYAKNTRLQQLEPPSRSIGLQVN